MNTNNRAIITLLCSVLLISTLPFVNESSFAQSESGSVKQVSCGYEHTGILKTDGSLWMTGQNNRGQLGDGTTEKKVSPVKIMDNVAQVSCGNFEFSYTGIVKTDGSLWMTGDCNRGELGNGTCGRKTSPEKIMDDVAWVECGRYSTGILKTDGSLWMTGMNGYGQLGDGTTENKTSAVKIMDNVAQVSCGYDHTGILKTDGSLWMTGCNQCGQLGDGTTKNKISPVKIMDNVAQVSCGGNFTGILKKDGSLWMTGYNSAGHLGDGTTEDKTSPVKIMDNVAQVSCGGCHTGILKKDGSLWMTGFGEALGDGTTENKTSPVKIMDNVAQVSCGGCHTGILKKDGSLWMTGRNHYGMLGDGTTEDKHAPVKIMEGNGEPDVNTVLSKKLQFNGGMYKNENYKWTEISSDWGFSLFESSSSLPNDQIAVASLILSSSIGDWNKHKQNLGQLGFTKVSSGNLSVYNDVNRVGYSISSAETTLNGVKTNVILVVCRGSTNTEDWISNIFQQAQGFRYAAEDVKNGLDAHIAAADLDTNLPTKLIITGHSRGGAVANILGTMVSDIADKDDTFVYTFACPNTTTASNRASYTNIFNVLVDGDPVPAVPFMIGGNNKFGRIATLYAQPDNQNFTRTFSMLTGGVSTRAIDDALAGGGSDYDVLGLPMARHHAPTVYMACLLSPILYSGDSELAQGLARKTQYRIRCIAAHCPVDIYVYDSDNNLLGTIINNEPSESLKSYGVSAVINGDEKYIYTGLKNDLIMKIVGTDTGEMKYENQEIDITTGEVVSETAFEKVKLSDGKLMSSTFSGDIADNDTKLYVVDEGNTIIAEVQEDGTEVDPLHVHTWKTSFTVDRQATCTTNGTKSYHCKDCNAIKADSSTIIPATGHNYGSWKTIKEPTYTTAGSREKVCANCGDKVTEPIPKLDRTGWHKIDGEWYYFKSNGQKATNAWAKDSKGWCWMGDSGRITKSKWIKSGGEWYYLKSNGYMAAKAWAKDSGGWYWMNGSGKIAKNVWAKDSGGWYWMNGSGRIAKNAWAKDSKGWCWMGSNGRMVKSKWVKYRNDWYYLNASGYMVTGTQKIGGKTYRFDKSGKWIS